MPKEMLAILGLAISLVVTVFGFGMRLGTLTERVEAQSRQLDLLATEVRAVNQHLIAYVAIHQREPRR